MQIKEINLANLNQHFIPTNNNGPIDWVISAILYSSYNSILLIPVLITLKDYIQNKKKIFCVAIAIIAILSILSLSIFFILLKVDVDISKIEMPAVYVIANTYPILKIAYGFIILASILTTAISLGNSVLNNIVKTERNYKKASFFLCFVAIIVSQFGFSNLVNLLYPLFGYLGILQILFIFNKILN